MSHDHSQLDPSDRLRALADQPIDSDVRATHLRRAAAAAPAPAPRRFGPGAIAAAAVVGFLAGSTGLATAGALPDPAQNIAHDVLEVVRVEVPEGGNRGACVSKAAKIEDEEAKQAAKDACPKGNDADDEDDGDAPGKSGDAPGKSGDAPGKSGDAPGRSGDAPGRVKHADDPCRGRPPWAGPMTEEERSALKEAHSRDACVDDDGGDDDASSQP